MGNSFVRLVQNSHFDHIAMVVKFESDKDEIYLVEATGNMGVVYNTWSYLRDHVGQGKFWEKVVYRHVDFDRESE